MDLDDVRKLSPMERLVYWIKERESIRLKRERGESAPWTDDPILRAYRFCNVRRMDDRVSRWLLDNWYRPFRDHPNMLYAAAIARFVNKSESLEKITQDVFPAVGPGPFWEVIKAKLRAVKKSGGTVFNGAYMVRGNSTKSPDKVGTVVDEYVGSLVAANVEVDTSSMERTHAAIVPVYWFGSFMAGQVVADLRWALTGTWKDKNTWAPLGPGSIRGLKRLYADSVNATVSTTGLTEFMNRYLSEIRTLLPGELSKRLEAMDLQNVLCETDKYNRVLWGEGKPKQLYRVVAG